MVRQRKKKSWCSSSRCRTWDYVFACLWPVVVRWLRIGSLENPLFSGWMMWWNPSAWYDHMQTVAGIIPKASAFALIFCLHLGINFGGSSNLWGYRIGWPTFEIGIRMVYSTYFHPVMVLHRSPWVEKVNGANLTILYYFTFASQKQVCMV